MWDSIFGKVSSPPPAKRGILIVDANAILSLCGAIPEDILIRPPKSDENIPRFLDTLTFLAKHGFEIILPEMVANEICHVVRDGFSLNRYFCEVNVKFKSDKITEKYLADNLASGLLKIPPPHDCDQTEAAIYIKKLFAIHADEITGPSQKRQSIISLDNQYKKKKKNFGDVAAREFVRGMPFTDLPVFYFSDDTDAQKKMMDVRAEMNIRMLTIHDFFDALFRKDILPQINITPIKPDIMMKILAKQAKILGVDFNFTTYIGCSNAANTIAFASTLNGLNEAPCTPVKVGIFGVSQADN